MKQGFQHMYVCACMHVGGVWVYTCMCAYLSFSLSFYFFRVLFLEAAVDRAYL